jgi:hypothetical protein
MKVKLVHRSSGLFKEGPEVEVWQRPMCGFMVLNSKPQLPKVVLTSYPTSRFSRTLSCRNQNRQQDANDPENYEYFDEG